MTRRNLYLKDLVVGDELWRHGAIKYNNLGLSTKEFSSL